VSPLSGNEERLVTSLGQVDLTRGEHRDRRSHVSAHRTL